MADTLITSRGRLTPMSKNLCPALSWLTALALLTGMAPVAAGETTITGGGATFPYPLYKSWLDNYPEKSLHLEYEAIGNGGGLKEFKAGKFDFSGLDGGLLKKDDSWGTNNKPILIPTAGILVCVIYNLPGIKQTVHLDGKTLADIFLGKITNWNDSRLRKLNPVTKFPALPILVTHRSDGSTTTRLFTTFLSSASPEWLAEVGSGASVDWPVGIGGKGCDGVAGTTKTNPGSIGYVEYTYAQQNGLQRAILKNTAGNNCEANLENAGAALLASRASLERNINAPVLNASGPNSYPICGLTYILLKRTDRGTDKARQLAGFLLWGNSEGQKYAAPLNYIPLPNYLRVRNKTVLEEFTGPSSSTHSPHSSPSGTSAAP